MDDDIDRVELDYLREKALKSMTPKKRDSSRRDTRQLESDFGLSALLDENRLHSALRETRRGRQMQHAASGESYNQSRRPARHGLSPERGKRDSHNQHLSKYSSRNPASSGRGRHTHQSPPRKKRRRSSASSSRSSYSSSTRSKSRSRSRSSYSSSQSSSRSRSRSSTSSSHSSNSFSHSDSSPSSSYSHSTYTTTTHSRSVTPAPHQRKPDKTTYVRHEHEAKRLSHPAPIVDSLESLKRYSSSRGRVEPRSPGRRRYRGQPDYSRRSPLPPHSSHSSHTKFPPPSEKLRNIRRSPPPLHRHGDPYREDRSYHLSKRRHSPPPPPLPPPPPPEYYDRHPHGRRSGNYRPRSRGPPPPPPPPPPMPPHSERRVVRKVTHRGSPNRSPPRRPPRDYYDDRRYDRGPPRPPSPHRHSLRREDSRHSSQVERELHSNSAKYSRERRRNDREEARIEIPKSPRQVSYDRMKTSSHARPSPARLSKSSLSTYHSKFDRSKPESDTEDGLEIGPRGGEEALISQEEKRADRKARKRTASESFDDEVVPKEKISKPTVEDSDEELHKDGWVGENKEEKMDSTFLEDSTRDTDTEDLLRSGSGILGDEELDYDENMEDLEVYPTGSIGDHEEEESTVKNKGTRLRSASISDCISLSPPQSPHNRRQRKVSHSDEGSNVENTPIHSPIRVSPERKEPRVVQERGQRSVELQSTKERLPAKERLYISKRTIEERERIINLQDESPSRLRPSLANRLGPSPVSKRDHSLDNSHRGRLLGRHERPSKGSAIEIAEAYRRKKRQEKNIAREEEVQKAKNITKMLNDSSTSRRSKPHQGGADRKEKEQALDRRISEIKEQNKAIMKRNREIERDKRLYA